MISNLYPSNFVDPKPVRKNRKSAGRPLSVSNKRLIANMERITVGTVLTIRGPLETLYANRSFKALVIAIESDPEQVIIATAQLTSYPKNESVVLMNPTAINGCAHLHGGHWMVTHIDGERIK